MMNRLELNNVKHPNFFGCWMLENKSLCDDLVQFFELRKASHRPGISGLGKVDKEIKHSTDLLITPVDLQHKNFRSVSTYTEHLTDCYLDYLEQWEFLKSFVQRIHIGPFNIQKYDQGGHFQSLHAERTSLHTLHRVFAWMTYLNDVSEGGETEFPMYDLKIKPEKGKTLIWPAEWTHAHKGATVKKGSKYIITGWMHFPDSGG